MSHEVEPGTVVVVRLEKSHKGTDWTGYDSRTGQRVFISPENAADHGAGLNQWWEVTLATCMQSNLWQGTLLQETTKPSADTPPRKSAPQSNAPTHMRKAYFALPEPFSVRFCYVDDEGCPFGIHHGVVIRPVDTTDLRDDTVYTVTRDRPDRLGIYVNREKVSTGNESVALEPGQVIRVTFDMGDPPDVYTVVDSCEIHPLAGFTPKMGTPFSVRIHSIDQDNQPPVAWVEADI